MRTVVAVLVWAVELTLTVALAGGVLIALSFSSEGHKRGMLPLHQALNYLALFLAVLPFGVTLWVGYRHFLSGRPNSPLGLALPVVVGVSCGVASLLAMLAGEKFSNVGAEARARRVRAEVRQKTEAGQREFACQVVVTDPASTAEDMRRCRAYVDAQTTAREKWDAFWPFILGQTSWKTWNPQQVGLSPFQDPEVALTVVRHEQAWFLRTFFESLLEAYPTFSYLEVELLHGTLLRMNRESGWSREAIEPLRSHILPELLRRIEPRPGVDLDGAPTTLQENRELIAALLATGPREPPPVPASASAPPADAIGVVKMTESGALEFWMRATAAEGNIGDVYFRQEPETPGHQQWMNVLGPMSKGQLRPVPPLKAP